MSTLAAVIAANRFGLGARPGEVAAIGSDERGWLTAQIRAQHASGGIDSSAKRFLNLIDEMQNPDPMVPAGRQAKQLYMQDVVWRTQNAITTESPFAERLVQFWSNHLAVSVDRQKTTPFVVAYENEAIRPHIFGNFADMVLASARHVAMLIYLDNIRSFGPNSMAMQRRQQAGNNAKGLNENYAREVMELHTLGVDGGYTQTDVRELAKILTGWSLDKQNGGFDYRNQVHEPGAHTVMGRSFSDNGEQQGISALRYLCAHPATAKHIATKLAKHFISDNPSEGSIAALANSFAQSNGDLAAVTRTLISLDECWQPRPLKYKSPNEHVISCLRAVGARTIDVGVVASFDVLGQRAFGAPSPQGWPDIESSWLSGDGLMRRIEWSQAMAAELPSTVDARKIAVTSLGSWLSGDTAFMLQGAPTPTDALALLFLAPEFQRR